MASPPRKERKMEMNEKLGRLKLRSGSRTHSTNFISNLTSALTLITYLVINLLNFFQLRVSNQHKYTLNLT